MEELQKIPNGRKGSSCRTLACDWHRFGGENEVCNSRNHFYAYSYPAGSRGLSTHALWIEGAIQGIPKTQISAAKKQELRTFFQTVS